MSENITGSFQTARSIFKPIDHNSHLRCFVIVIDCGQ